jgi:hypothetical protein
MRNRQPSSYVVNLPDDMVHTQHFGRHRLPSRIGAALGETELA